MATYYPLDSDLLYWTIGSGLADDFEIVRVVTTETGTTTYPGMRIGWTTIGSHETGLVTDPGRAGLEVRERSTGRTLVIGWRGTVKPNASGAPYQTAELATESAYYRLLKAVRQVEAAEANVRRAFRVPAEEPS